MLCVPDTALLVDAVRNMDGLASLHVSIDLQTYICSHGRAGLEG